MNENKTQHNSGLFRKLFGAGMLGVIMYALLLTRLLSSNPILLETNGPPPPPPVLMVLIVLQTGVLLAVAVWGGLKLAKQINFHPAPLLTQQQPISKTALVSVLPGLVGGVVTFAIYLLFVRPATNLPFNIATEVPFWLGMANALLYGGITEELLIRLGLMTLLLWLASRSQGDVSVGRFWVVNTVVFAAFALLHLPAATTLLGIAITPLVVVAVLVLNVVSLLFGWLYWKRGIEAAMVAHIAFHLGYTLPGLLIL